MSNEIDVSKCIYHSFEVIMAAYRRYKRGIGCI